MINFTPEQRAAVESRESSLVVSAAAGSGKTAVLASRVLSLLCDSDNPCGIDELLVVTFTNAAAAEMKERISRNIAERLAAEPGNTHLRRQMALIGDSRIQTVHAFCQRLLRENAELCGIPSDFALADHIESEQLRRHALDMALEEAYARDDGGDFYALCRAVNEERGDSRLCAALLDVYERLRSHPEPERWLRETLTEAESFSPDNSRWCAEVLREACETAAFAGRCASEAGKRLREIGEAAEKHAEIFERYAACVKELRSAIEKAATEEECTLPQETENLRQYCSDVWDTDFAKSVRKDESNSCGQIEKLRSRLEAALQMKDDGGGNSEELSRELNELRIDAEFAENGMCVMRDRLKKLQKTTEKYGAMFAGFAAYADGLQNAAADGWQAAYEYLRGFKSPKIYAPGFDDGDLLEEIKAEKEAFCGRVERLCREYITADEKRLAEESTETLGATRAFCRLILELDRLYSEEKRRKKLLDFSDLEHLTYRILSDGKGGRSALAERVSAGFREILIDEYQDTNEVQESIFSRLKPERGSMFFVGDVKQSIYRFRLAEPNIFMKRYLAGGRIGEGDGEKSMELSRNFRSRPEVLELCNFIFSRIMSLRLGEVDYDERQSLKAGREVEGAEPVEVYVIDADSGDGKEEKAALEARFVSARIEQMLKNDRITGADGELRPLRPGDFAILLSSYANKAYHYGRELTKLGIPVNGAGKDEFYSCVEISVMLSLLRIIDNRRQDIPLISVMRSPLYFFTPDELAEIRLAQRGGDFYDALLTCSENAHVKKLLEDLDKYTLAACDMSPEQLLRHIYAESGAEGVFSALDKGAARRENLEKLRGMAAEFSASRKGGLYAFLRYMDKKIELDEYPESPESGDAVRIMSIHKSKGLEFPVVFVPDLAKRFNTDDMARPVLFHKDMGVAFKCRDHTARTEYRSQFQRAVALRMKREMLSEEIRKLYVALTRARERLVLTMAVKNPREHLDEIKKQVRGGIDPQYLAEQSGAMAWICAALMQHEEASELRGGQPTQGRRLTCRVATAPAAAVRSGEKAPEVFAADDEDAAELRFVEWKYRYEEAARLPSKLTPTGIRGEYPEAGEAEGTPANVTVRMFREVGMLSAGHSAREAGTDIHVILSRIDFDACTSFGAVEQEVKKLAVSMGVAADRTSARMVYDFVGSYAGQRMREASRVLREYRFGVFFTPDELLQNGDTEDNILMNGAMDMLLFGEGGMTVIDFKSDFVTAGGEQRQAEKHRLQLEIYAMAAEKIFGLPVREKIVHFLRTGTSIII